MSAQGPLVRAGRQLAAVHPDTDAFTALTVMRRSELRHLPVVQADRCVGLLTEAHLLGALASASSAAQFTAGGLCQRPAPSVPAGATLPAMAGYLVASGTDAALVVSRGVMVGMVTGTDVLGAVTGRWRTQQAATN